jgi:hypothetical protein
MLFNSALARKPLAAPCTRSGSDPVKAHVAPLLPRMKARGDGVKRTGRLPSKLCVAYGFAFGWGLCDACGTFAGTKRIATARLAGSSLMFSISFLHQIRAAELAQLSLVRREAMAGWLGSACHLFVLRAA